MFINNPQYTNINEIKRLLANKFVVENIISSTKKEDFTLEYIEVCEDWVYEIDIIKNIFCYADSYNKTDEYINSLYIETEKSINYYVMQNYYDIISYYVAIQSFIIDKNIYFFNTITPLISDSFWNLITEDTSDKIIDDIEYLNTQLSENKLLNIVYSHLKKNHFDVYKCINFNSIKEAISLCMNNLDNIKSLLK